MRGHDRHSVESGIRKSREMPSGGRRSWIRPKD
jgi:hypothetical protein